MNMLQFELFASVARTQNISRTAEQYNVSQPAVSHQLKTLEQAMGLELIHRTKRGVVLTDAGRELLPYVQEILSIKDRAETRMRNMAEGTVGHIRIAALSSASARWTSACWRAPSSSRRCGRTRTTFISAWTP